MMTRLHAIPIALVALAAAAFGAAVLAENIDPLSNNSQFAWSENAGWLNAEPANCGDCGVQVRNTGLTGYMWGENLGWINLSCKNNSTCAGPAGNWGVTNNGSGALAGYAWAENAGWISFSCANSSCTGPAASWGVSVDGSTGTFSGDAWGENIGWISFSASSPVAYQVQTSDEDADGIFAGSDNCPLWSNAAQALPNWPVPPVDSDCDGFSDSVGQALLAPETYIGTDPTRQCATDRTRNNEQGGAGGGIEYDRWPMDFDDNQLANGSDFLTFIYSISQSASGPPITVPGGVGTFERTRWDFSGNGIINGQDFLKFINFIGKLCS